MERYRQFLARDSIIISALYAVARPSVHRTRWSQDMQFSPYGSPIPLVFEVQVSSKNSDGL